MAYFLDVPNEELPFLDVPLNTLIRLTPSPYGNREIRYRFDLDAFSQGASTFWSESEMPLTKRSSPRGSVCNS